MTFANVLRQRLDSLFPLNQHRELRQRSGIDFSSNDYLDFSCDPELRARVQRRGHDSAVALGATGSRLLRGHTEDFERLDEDLAQFSGRHSALFFSSGYLANLGLLSAVLTRDDWVFSDSLNHASLIDGIRLSGAQKFIYPHGDLASLEKLLEAKRNESGLKLVVTESVFSMEGDLAPLREICRVAEKYGAQVIVDEAHATGLWGANGLAGGRVQELGLSSRVLASIHTAGKAMGSAGAWIACDKDMKDYLINFCRTFVFSTAPSPFIIAALSEALKFWREVGPERITALASKRQRLARATELESPSPIFSVLFGSNARASSAAEKLQAQGFDVRAIRPPTVPLGSARLRITLRSGTGDGDIDRLARALQTLREKP